jgi:hypothetical protein
MYIAEALVDYTEELRTLTAAMRWELSVLKDLVREEGFLERTPYNLQGENPPSLIKIDGTEFF